jgi:hypothetical protein
LNTNLKERRDEPESSEYKIKRSQIALEQSRPLEENVSRTHTMMHHSNTV